MLSVGGGGYVFFLFNSCMLETLWLRGLRGIGFLSQSTGISLDISLNRSARDV